MVKSQERLPYERAQGKVTITSDGKELVHMKKPNSKSLTHRDPPIKQTPPKGIN